MSLHPVSNLQSGDYFPQSGDTFVCLLKVCNRGYLEGSNTLNYCRMD